MLFIFKDVVGFKEVKLIVLFILRFVLFKKLNIILFKDNIFLVNVLFLSLVLLFLIMIFWFLRE